MTLRYPTSLHPLPYIISLHSGPYIMIPRYPASLPYIRNYPTSEPYIMTLRNLTQHDIPTFWFLHNDPKALYITDLQWATSGTSTYQRNTQRRTPSGHQHGSSAVPETSDRSLELCWYHAGTSQVPSLVLLWFRLEVNSSTVSTTPVTNQQPSSDPPPTYLWPPVTLPATC